MQTSRRSSWVVTFAVSALVVSSAAMAAGPQVHGQRVEGDKASTRWTAERYANAKPFEVEVDLAALEAAADDLAAQLDAELGPEAAERSSVAGFQPTVEPRLQPRQLFSAADRLVDSSEVTPDSVGSGAGHYTSSRVFPSGAETYYPYRTVGKIYFSFDGSDYVCSGAVIRKRLVLTAGHCLHQGEGGQSGFHSDVVFVPALRGGSAPYGEWTASYLWVTNAWYTGGGAVPNTADYAIIEINDRRISGVVRKIGDYLGSLGWITNRLLTDNHLTLLGYPQSMDSGTTMHRVDSNYKKKTTKNTAEYGSDMTGGSSGGPWVQDFGEKAVGQSHAGGGTGNQAVGVTSYGYTNAGVKLQGSSNFTTNIFNGLINTACARKAGNC